MNAAKVFLGCSMLLAASTGIARRAGADDFRIETKVFSGKETEPVSETLTVFRGGQVFDFINKPSEITVFDKPRGRVILLDPTRKIRAEIKSDRLTAFADELKTWAAKQTDPFLKFAAEPRFDQTLEASGELVFTSPFVTYRVATIKADSDAISRQYLEFANSYARLNAITNPGSTPPFPRMAVNDALFKTGSMPERLQVATQSRQRFAGKPSVMRSEHAVHWRLLEADLKKISEADQYLVTFTPVTLEKYLLIGASDEKH